MAYQIADTFNDPLGRFNQVAPWDSTMYYNSSKGFLTTQSHVDIRAFRVINETGPKPQNLLERTPQTALEPVPQTSLETQITNTLTEPWVLTGSGLSGMVTGASSARGGWSRLALTTTGAAVDATITSSIPTDNLDISGMTKLSFLTLDYNSWDTNSYIQLSSDPAGVFGNGADSAQVAFSSNLSVAPQILLNVSAFAQSGFNNTRVTGVRIRLRKAVAPGAAQTATVAAIRAVTNTWSESALDFDTRLEALCVPVTLTGSAYGGSVATAFEFIRGDGTANDPIPVDGAFNMFFYPGGQTSPNDATGGTFNQLDFLLRENKDTGAGTGSIEVARLKWNDSSTVFEAQRIDMTGGAGGTRTPTTLLSQNVGNGLSASGHYLFRVEIVGTQTVARLYNADVNCVPGSIIWSSAPVTSSSLIRRSGRVGFTANLVSRDSYLLQLDAAPTGFASLETAPAMTYTPVDGAQLAVKYAADLNLFDKFTGADLSIDPTKTLSGNGSFRASEEITSNQFIVEDWTQTYLSAQIWVGNSVSISNQPQIVLITPSGTAVIPTEKLSPNQWNLVEVDLGVFSNLITGVGYSIKIQPGVDPDRSLGTFWVDETVVGRRKVSWALRAGPNNPYREFRGLVNGTKAAVHLNPAERGTAPQLQARALTSDAWIAIEGGIKLKLHFAELGNPVYDVAAWH